MQEVVNVISNSNETFWGTLYQEEAKKTKKTKKLKTKKSKEKLN